jgi:hypothetical protein
MSGSTIGRGNILRSNIYSLSLSPASVAPNTTAEQTFTFAGLQLNDFVDVMSVGTQQAGLSLGNSRVTAANTLGIVFGNNTAATITPTSSATYLLRHAVSEYQPLQTQA